MPTRLRMVTVAAVLGAAATLVAMALTSRHGADARTSDDGIPWCSAEAGERLLSHHALQCWFGSERGRWRILEQYSAHGVLIVHVHATSADDAEAIARQFVLREGAVLPEILVYVNSSPAGSPPATRRVQWTRSGGFDVIDFAGATFQ